MFAIVSSPCLSLIFHHFSDIQLSVEEAVWGKNTSCWQDGCVWGMLQLFFKIVSDRQVDTKLGKY